MLKVKTIVNGILSENCYIAYQNKEALIIDPGYDADKIIDYIESQNLKVVGILITHYHFDHVGALKEIQSKYNKVETIDNDSSGKIKLSSFTFDIIKTPGHTLDSVSYYFKGDNILFTGDFVFKETIGNYDEDNEYIMLESLTNFITFPNDTVIYPGHGESSTVEHEKKHNPYLRGI